MDQNAYVDLTVNQLIETWHHLSKCLTQHPDKLIQNQINYWQAYSKMYEEAGFNPASREHDTIDKRFQHKDWQENVSFHFIKQSYLLLSQHINSLIKEITTETDARIAHKLQFYTKQFIDASSPTNFAHLNPDILSRTLETNGINLMKGMQHFLRDLEEGKGQLNIKTTDFTFFKLGENIACTPGKVIYQNDMMQLIQYGSNTQTIYQYPLLIIPPWINKYYILDLQQENSLVKWLVDQGFTVFMISWVNPNQQHKEKQFSDYMFDGPLAALNIIKKITGEDQVNLVGYCIGGTLLGCLLAYLAKKKETGIHSATFFTTLFDFSEPGELGVFIDNDQLNILEKHMEKTGYLHGHIMAAVFNMLRANDLIWSAFVNHYLKGQPLKPFDLLYWNADSTNIPAQAHRFYLRNMYLENNLIQPNKMELADTLLDLKQINVPAYFLAAQDDHIVPWKSAYKSSQFYGGKIKFALTTSGHVAGVVNPPHRNKYGYWTAGSYPHDPDKFLSEAKYTQGSWWNDWIEWLKNYSGKVQSAAELKNNEQHIIEEAPGAYVKVRLNM